MSFTRDLNCMPPKITVFMAAYNAADYIRGSINSILEQTFKDFELLIINDGSTDQTVAVIAEFNDPRIRLIHNDRNLGLVFTRNVALKEARGEYIAVLDSDDIAIPNRLELQYNFFSQNSETALCGGHGIVIDKNGETLSDKRLTVPIGNDNIKITLLFRNAFVNSTVMFKTAVFKELQGYQDYAPAEDYQLFIRIANKYPVNNLDHTLVKYRYHNANTSVIQVDVGEIKINAIKKLQLTNFQINAEQKLIDAFHSILNWNLDASSFSDYLLLFTKLKSANEQLKRYPIVLFEKALFNYWFEIILNKKAKMNAMSLLLNKALFKWSYVNSKMLRKTFKLSIKGIGQISK